MFSIDLAWYMRGSDTAEDVKGTVDYKTVNVFFESIIWAIKKSWIGTNNMRHLWSMKQLKRIESRFLNNLSILLQK